MIWKRSSRPHNFALNQNPTALGKPQPLNVRGASGNEGRKGGWEGLTSFSARVRTELSKEQTVLTATCPRMLVTVQNMQRTIKRVRTTIGVQRVHFVRISNAKLDRHLFIGDKIQSSVHVSEFSPASDVSANCLPREVPSPPFVIQRYDATGCLHSLPPL